MKIHSLLAVGAAASMAVVSSADYTGVTGTVDDSNDGYYVINVFANFDDSNNVLLNVFDMTISMSSGSGFNQEDTNTLQGGNGSWDFQTTLNLPGTLNAAIDSYVSMGADAASLDPGYAGGLGVFIPDGAGWFDGTPTSYAQGTSIRLGQFTVANDGSTADTFTFSGQIGWKGQPDHTNVQFGAADFTAVIPAPGALALLGVGGLIARRRRA